MHTKRLLLALVGLRLSAASPLDTRNIQDALSATSEWANQILAQYHFSNHTRPTKLDRRDDEGPEPGEYNRCTSVRLPKGVGIPGKPGERVPMDVRAWGITLEKDQRFDEICGREFLRGFREFFRGECHRFPVWVKDWKCDRLDIPLMGTYAQVPPGTVWMTFVTKNEMYECEADKGTAIIKEVGYGLLNDIYCMSIDIGNIPVKMDLKDLPEARRSWH
jgi:hypothetical protein